MAHEESVSNAERVSNREPDSVGDRRRNGVAYLAERHIDGAVKAPRLRKALQERHVDDS